MLPLGLILANNDDHQKPIIDHLCLTAWPKLHRGTMFIDSLHPQFPGRPPQRAGQRLCFNKILSNSGFPNPRALEHRVSNSLPVAALVPQALYRCPLSFGRGGKIEGICLPGIFWKSPFHWSCSNLASRFSDMSSFVQKFMPCFLEGASPLPCFGLGSYCEKTELQESHDLHLAPLWNTRPKQYSSLSWMHISYIAYIA